MKRPKLIVAGIAAVLILIVGFQNTDAIETQVLFYTVRMPRVALIVTTLGIGVVLGYLWGRRIRRHTESHTG